MFFCFNNKRLVMGYRQKCIEGKEKGEEKRKGRRERKGRRRNEINVELSLSKLPMIMLDMLYALLL